MKSVKYLIWAVLAILLVANIFAFVYSIKLTDEINNFEKQATLLHEENTNLEKKLYEVDSLQFASSMAAQLDYSEKTQPIFLDTARYALNR